MNNEKALNRIYNKHPLFSWSQVDFTLEPRPGVYCIYNCSTREVYIGKATNCKQRIRSHITRLSNGTHSNERFALHAKGADMKFFVIQYTEFADTAKFLEAHYVSVFGFENLINSVNMNCTCFEKDSSEECFSTASRLGYKIYEFNGRRYSFAHGSNETSLYDHNREAVERSRKPIGVMDTILCEIAKRFRNGFIGLLFGY